ncbi:hypothetical protein DYH55_23110 [Methylovirgula sp. 4M-Z18]|nr:hypothetical protein DYH55_23110 [Methylovirgula sp. 4M-Z18]
MWIVVKLPFLLSSCTPVAIAPSELGTIAETEQSRMANERTETSRLDLAARSGGPPAGVLGAKGYLPAM